MARLVIVLAAVLNFYFFESTAQSFQKSISNNIYAIDACEDGGLIATGNYIAEILLIKFEVSGNTSWAKKITSSTQSIFVRTIKEAANGSFLIGGYLVSENSDYSSFFIKTDVNGQITFSKAYFSEPSTLLEVKDIEETTNGYILATSTAIMKTDLDGNIIWAKSIDAIGFNAVEVESDGFVFAGFYNGTDKDGFVCKTDFNGEVIWARTYAASGDEELLTLSITSDGKYMFTGRSQNTTTSSLFLKTDNEGEILVCKELNTDSGLKTLYNVVESPDNNYVMIGNTNSGIDLLLKLSTSGNMLWAKNFGPKGAQPAIVKNASSGFFFQKSNNQIAKVDNQGDGVCTRLNETIAITNFALETQSLTTSSTDIIITSNDFNTTIEDYAITVNNVNPIVSINAGPDLSICKNSSLFLSGVVSGPYLNAYWEGGSGSYTPTSLSLTTSYVPSNSEVTNTETVTLTLHINGASCGTNFDEMKISIEGDPTIANAGEDIPACSTTVTLNANTATSGRGLWSFIKGSGAFTNPTNPKSSVSNISEFPSQLKWTISNSCGSKYDVVIINQAPALTVEAGDNISTCNKDTVRLTEATSAGASSYSWTGGSGVFVSGTDLNPKYVPSASEISNGSVQLTLTATGICQSKTDVITIIIDQLPSTLIPADKNVCGSQTTTPMIFNLADGSDGSGFWTGGNGTFTPDRNAVVATYTPTSSEVSSGKILLTWNQPSALGLCPANSATTKIIYNSQPTVSAGANLSTCMQEMITLNGSVNNAPSFVWSGGAGTFTPNANVLNPVYKPAVSEIGTNVTLTLKAIAYPGCSEKYSTTILSVDGNPSSVSTDADVSICADGSANLQASTSGPGYNSTYMWIGGNGTFNPDRSALNATYTPSQSEINAGTVTLTFQQASLFNACPLRKSIESITIKKLPQADAGEDITACINTPTQLNATTSVAGGGTWSGGNGTYSPSANDKNALYTPTLAEINTGSITLVFTPTSNGCSVSSDEVSITFDVCDGIFESNTTENIHVAPNPSSGNFYFSYEGKSKSACSLKVFSSEGRVVAENNTVDLSQEQSIDMSGLPAGIYMLQVISDGKVGMKKLVKE